MSRAFIPEPDVNIPSGEPIGLPQEEFEFVLGKRQVASVSLVILTALAAFTGIAYMVGKSSGKTVEAAKPAAVVVPAPAPQAAAPVDAKPAVAEAPIFGAPEQDRLYIQVGSVERGFAALMVQGARKAGYSAIAAGGTNANVYRVLVGPFPNQEVYAAAKTALESMGLNTFSRKYSASGNPEVTDAGPSGTPEP